MAFESPRSWKSTAIWLGLFFVLALTLRIAFSAESSFDESEGRYLYSGNDPWFHDRTVGFILDHGESMTSDPLDNYPSGAGNPNPPLYDWTTAVDAKALEWAGATDPISLALNIAVAFWGAITVFPVFVIAKELWGRKAGLWAAFFMAVSAPHIQRSVWGFADHDATTIFWITTTFALLLKGVSAIKRRDYVTTWRSGVAAEVRQALTDNRIALTWATLAGLSLTATALTWKGYPYALAIMAIAYGFQLLADHARNKDSTVIAAVYLIPVILSLILPLWYYDTLGLTRTTIMPNLYVLVGMLVVGAVLVPTRELPSILVFPALAGAALLGLVLMLFVFPSVGDLIFSGLGYFRQTKLYTTIAEAQRTELGSIAAGFGFFTFVLAFWPLGHAIRRAWKGEVPMMLIAAWGVVAFFMAFAASRFVVNATPIFVVFMGAATAWVIERWAGLAEVRRRRRAQHGQHPVSTFFSSLTWRSTLVIFLVAFFLVLPNAWIGVDAGTSFQFDRDNGLVDSDDSTVDRFGAYGVSYDLESNGWLEMFDHLATLDTDLPMEDRPGFIAWWDYGHWATSLGHHPTVADPFQNHHRQAGRFLASESEEAAVDWLSILILDADARGGFSDEVAGVMADHGLDADAYRAVGKDDDAKFEVVQGVDDHYAFYDDLVDTTGKEIRYLGVDSRMYPLGAGNTGIFYAPVFLANKNPDDFLQITYSGTDPSTGSNLVITLHQYGVDENGDSYGLPEPKFLDQEGNEWIVAGGQAYPAKNFIPGAGASGQGVPVQPDFQLTDRFYQSMYTRAYGGPAAANQVPANGLEHWRAIDQATRGSGTNEFRLTALLEYYRGHTVTGAVVDEGGQPMADVAVTFVDGFGAAHQVAITDSDGGFEVLAPFGEDLRLVVQADNGAPLFEEPWSLSRDEARGGRTDGVILTVAYADLDGHIYRDLDGNGAYDDGEGISGATVTLDGGAGTTTTSSDGSYSFTDLTADGYTMSVDADGFQETSTPVILAAGASSTKDVALTPVPSEVTVTFTSAGDPVAGVPVRFEGPQTLQVTTGADGTQTTSLTPGTYTVTVDHSYTTTEGQEVVYEASKSITIPLGGDPFSFTIQDGEQA